MACTNALSNIFLSEMKNMPRPLTEDKTFVMKKRNINFYYVDMYEGHLISNWPTLLPIEICRFFFYKIIP